VARRRRPLGFYDAQAAQTTFISPPDWSHEKLLGYVSAHHAELERVCGPIARIRQGGAAAC
jgi:hypothetical protein